MINYIKNGHWLNGDYTRDLEMQAWRDGYKLCIILRLAREDNNQRFSITVITQINIGDDNWDDLKWEPLLDGNMDNIEGIITEDFYNDLLNKLTDCLLRKEYYITEEDIESYINQFPVDRRTAIREIADSLDFHYKEQESSMEETYQSIIRSSY